MKIDSLQIYVIRRTLPRIAVNDKRIHIGGEIRQALLRIRTEEGVEGASFIGSQSNDAGEDIEAVLQMKSLIIGMDATDRERLWTEIFNARGNRVPPAHAWSAVDVALWDIAGKAAGMPLYKMLGAYRSEVATYATYPPMQTTPDGYAGEAEELSALGFPAYKIHPGSLSVDCVVSTVEVVRRRESGMTLMLDPNNGYNLKDALEVGKALDANGFRWFEDPVKWNNRKDIKELSRRLDTPIAMSDAPEFLLLEAARAASEGILPIVRGTARKLGVTGLRKLCATAEAFGIDCEIGLAGNSLMNAANLHVICSIANCHFYEWWLPSEVHQWGVIEEPKPDNRGILKPTEKPGLGVDLDEEWIEAHTEIIL